MVDPLPAGSIAITKCTLTSITSGKQIDIRGLVLEFSVFDNINKPFITASLALVDAVSLITEFPIVGHETLELEFNTPHPAFDKNISVLLRVIGIENFSRENARASKYILKCVTPEYIRSMTTKVRKSYGDMLVTEAAQKLYEEFIKVDKEIHIPDATQGLRTIVIPNMSPAEGMKFLAAESFSARFPASNYLFYQSFEGFKFMPIEKMIKEPANRKIERYYTTDFGFFDESFSAADVATNSGGSGGASQQSRKPVEFLKIQDFTFAHLTQYDKTSRLGALENTMRILDPVTSLWGQTKYNYFDDYDKFERTAEFSVKDHKWLPSYTDLTTETAESKIIYRLSNKDQLGNNYGNDQKDQYLQYDVASRAMLENIVVNVTVPGDSTRRAGDSVILGFPAYGGQDEVKGKFNKYISGEYLIVATRHMYAGGGYKMGMLCAKNGFEEADLEGTPLAQNNGSANTVSGLIPGLGNLNRL